MNPLGVAVLGLVERLVPVAQGLFTGTLEAQEARQQLLVAHRELQQLLQGQDAQLRANDAAADAAAALLPDAAPPAPAEAPHGE